MTDLFDRGSVDELVDPELAGDDGPPPPRARSKEAAPATPAADPRAPLLPAGAKAPLLPIHHGVAHAQMHANATKETGGIFSRILQERLAAVETAADEKQKLRAQAYAAIAEVELAHRKDEASLYRMLGQDDAAGVLRSLAKREVRR